MTAMTHAKVSEGGRGGEAGSSPSLDPEDTSTVAAGDVGRGSRPEGGSEQAAEEGAVTTNATPHPGGVDGAPQSTTPIPLPDELREPVIDESFGAVGLILPDRIIATNRVSAVAAPLPCKGKVCLNGR